MWLKIIKSSEVVLTIIFLLFYFICVAFVLYFTVDISEIFIKILLTLLLLMPIVSPLNFLIYEIKRLKIKFLEENKRQLRIKTKIYNWKEIGF